MKKSGKDWEKAFQTLHSKEKEGSDNQKMWKEVKENFHNSVFYYQMNHKVAPWENFE